LIWVLNWIPGVLAFSFLTLARVWMEARKRLLAGHQHVE